MIISLVEREKRKQTLSVVFVCAEHCDNRAKPLYLLTAANYRKEKKKRWSFLDSATEFGKLKKISNLTRGKKASASNESILEVSKSMRINF